MSMDWLREEESVKEKESVVEINTISVVQQADSFNCNRVIWREFYFLVTSSWN